MLDNRSIGVVLATAALAAAAIVAAPPASAAITIEVTPSPNGLIMAGIPSSIAATGFKGTAKVYRYDNQARKWSLLGTVAKGNALPYTFPRNGATKVKVVPKNGKAKTFVVPVYGKYVAFNDPQSFGATVLPVGLSVRGFPREQTAKEGCALVDVGLLMTDESGDPTSATAVVQSTGAPETRFSVANGGTVQSSIPIKGDAVVSIVDVVFPSGRGESRAGVVWYCLSADETLIPS